MILIQKLWMLIESTENKNDKKNDKKKNTENCKDNTGTKDQFIALVIPAPKVLVKSD